jgi:hypothetical protein
MKKHSKLHGIEPLNDVIVENARDDINADTVNVAEVTERTRGDNLFSDFLIRFIHHDFSFLPV